MPTQLALTLINGSPKLRPQTRAIQIPEYRLGRGEPEGREVDWILPDTTRTISRLHCVVSSDQDDWFVTDVSRNGTFLNRESERLPPNRRHRLHDGDRVRIGPYEFQVQLEVQRLSNSADTWPREDPTPPRELDKKGLSATPNSQGKGGFKRGPDESGGMPDWGQDWLPEPTAKSEPEPEPRNQPAGDAGLLEQFLQGAGLPHAQVTDPSQTMRQLGETFRAMVSGLRAVQSARRTVRAGFRISDNTGRDNPLNAGMDEDAAMEALVYPRARSSMTPARAVEQTLTEIGHHELATIAAMRDAIRVLLTALSPDALRQRAEQSGGAISMLATQRKARAWDEFETRYAQIYHGLEDDFDRVFGKAFAEAYERAIDASSDRDRSR